MKIRPLLNILCVCIIILVFFFLFILQVHIDNYYKIQRQEERLLYLPSGKYLKPLCLGYEVLVADLLWLKAIGYFGGHYHTDRSYKWLYHILDLVTTLDPYFRYPYEFGGLILALEEGNFQQSIALMKKGLKYHSDYWRLYFYIGFSYFFYYKDAKRASNYITKAAQLPGSPSYLPKLAASLLTQAGQKEQGLTFLYQIYSNTEDEWLKTKIKEKIEKLDTGELPESFMNLFKK